MVRTSSFGTEATEGLERSKDIGDIRFLIELLL